MTVERHGQEPHQDNGRGDDDPGPLVSLRAALILFMALVVAAAAGTATYLAEGSVVLAVLAAGAAGWAVLLGLHSIVGGR